eukprot:scaffold22799_cov83-Skeletonema_dohrnii-CCMP3373.AAC.3
MMVAKTYCQVMRLAALVQLLYAMLEGNGAGSENCTASSPARKVVWKFRVAAYAMAAIKIVIIRT